MQPKPLPAAIGAMIGFLWIVGLFVGLPIGGWVLLVMATIGHIVYTSHKEAYGKTSDESKKSERPWRKDSHV